MWRHQAGGTAEAAGGTLCRPPPRCCWRFAANGPFINSAVYTCPSFIEQAALAVLALTALLTYQPRPLAPVLPGLPAAGGCPTAASSQARTGRARVYLTWSLRYGLTNQLYRYATLLLFGWQQPNKLPVWCPCCCMPAALGAAVPGACCATTSRAHCCAWPHPVHIVQPRERSGLGVNAWGGRCHPAARGLPCYVQHHASPPGR